MNRPLDAREWLESIYSKGVGVAADHALTLLAILDREEEFDELESAMGGVESALDDWDNSKNKTPEKKVKAIVGEIVAIDRIIGDDTCGARLVDIKYLKDRSDEYEVVIRALTAAGAIDETSDIPATIRMVLGP